MKARDKVLTMFTARYRQEKERRKQRGKNGSGSFINRKRKSTTAGNKSGKKEDLPKLARKGRKAEVVKCFCFAVTVKGKGLTCPLSSKKPLHFFPAVGQWGREKNFQIFRNLKIGFLHISMFWKTREKGRRGEYIPLFKKSKGNFKKVLWLSIHIKKRSTNL